MRPLRTRLQEARQRLGIPWEVLERDYLLSWILAGVSHMGEQGLDYQFPDDPPEKLTEDDVMAAMDRIFERAGI